jgi:hypothetical protein
VRREHGDPWDLRDSLELGRYCACHRRHTSAVARLSLVIVPAAAIAFAVQLLGEHQAAAYLARFYAA